MTPPGVASQRTWWWRVADEVCLHTVYTDPEHPVSSVTSPAFSHVECTERCASLGAGVVCPDTVMTLDDPSFVTIALMHYAALVRVLRMRGLYSSSSCHLPPSCMRRAF